MLNSVNLVGRIVENPTLKKEENGKKICYTTLAIPCNFKNKDGIYETDFIDCILYSTIAKTFCEYCKKGDLVGIRGMLRTVYQKNEDGFSKKCMKVVVEKVSFLASRKED